MMKGLVLAVLCVSARAAPEEDRVTELPGYTGETAQPRMPDNLLVADDDSQEDDQDDKVASNDCFFDDEELDADAPLFLQPGDPDKIRQLRK